MSIGDEWPEFMPDAKTVVDITNGVLTLGATTCLRNYAEYTWTWPQVVGQIYKNGTKVATLSWPTAGTYYIVVDGKTAADKGEFTVKVSYTAE